MKIATISQTKNNFSAMIDRVRNGETILIMDRNRPVARLEPIVTPGECDPEGRIERLERQGALRRGTEASVAEVLRKRPPRPREGGDVLEALLSERGQGR